MELTQLYYHFTTEGSRGGLHALDCALQPGREPQETLSAALRRGFRRLEALLDGMLLEQEGLDCDKRPIFTDSPHVTRVGHAYETRVSQAAAVQRRVRQLCGTQAVREPPSPGERGRCDLVGELDRGLGKASLRLEARLGHALNVALVGRLLALPEMKLSSRAEIAVRRLREVLDVYERDPSGLPQLLDRPDPDGPR